jgi:hypothetical protein
MPRPPCAFRLVLSVLNAHAVVRWQYYYLHWKCLAGGRSPVEVCDYSSSWAEGLHALY